MVRTFTATEFIEPALRGGNLPMIVRGIDANGEAASIFLKTRVGYGNRPAAPGVELFTALLAKEMGLHAPEPVIVDVPARFHEQVFDAPRYRTLLEASAGTNFGTVALGADWKTWPVEMSTRAFAPDLIEGIFLFDSMVQQTDRGFDNPNILWRGHQLAVVDHEKCFAYLPGGEEEARPWRGFFGHRPMHTHCLRTALKPEREGFGREFREQLLGLEMEDRIRAICHAATGAFP